MSWSRGQVLIQARNVSVEYRRGRSFFRSGRFTALQDITTDIRAGETLGVIGRNGVGKTTLLRVLADIIVPDRGTVENLGATTAMLSMQAGFDLFATGRTNIVLSGLLLGYTEQQIHERMDEIIRFSELREFIDQTLIGYSAGMRARLGFSVCYFMQPDVLLIDEALGVGDLEFRIKSAEAMREKIRSEQTVVLVSHDSNTIRSLCDRALWIENGVNRMEGETQQVVAAYQEYVTSHPRQS